MAVPTLILTPRMTDDSVALWRAAGRLGWNVERMTKFRLPDDFPHVDEPVLYVEGLTAPMIAEQLGVSVTEVPVDWLPSLPEEYRSRDVRLMTLRQARRLTGRWFIKPPNDKSFAASVYEAGELPTEFDDDMPVLVSEIVGWEVEFRCFMLNRRVVTQSVYLRDGVLQREAGFPASDEELAELHVFMQRMTSDARVPLPEATVVDAGIIRGKGWAIVEQNAAWASGIYGCDPEQVLHVLRRATQSHDS
jgi:hypothetical protein